MTVTVTKPQINIREELSSLKKKTGIKGEELLRANTVSDVYTSINPVMFRNIFINGDFRFSQRGTYTSATAIGSTYYLDRWSHNLSGGVTITHKLNQTLPDGTKANTALLTQTSTGYFSIAQWIEDYAYLAGKNITISFWAKTNIPCSFSHYNGVAQWSPPWQLTPDGVWRYYTWTTYNGATAGSFRPEIWSNSSTTSAGSYLEVANMQLEVGTVATPFERRPHTIEETMCKRYYQYDSNDGGAYVHLLSGTYVGSSSSYIMKQFPVTMRTTPTITFSAANTFLCDGNQTLTPSAIAGSGWTNNRSARISATVSGANGGQSFFLAGAGTGTCRINYDAEM